MSSTHIGIRGLYIRDFRGIDELSLSFVGPNDHPTQVVVLGGPNGCGKTAVLEACLAVMGQGILARRRVEKGAVRLGREDFLIEAAVQIGNRTENLSCTSSRIGRDVVACWYFSSERSARLVGAVGITAGRQDQGAERTEKNRLQMIKQFLVNAKAHALFPSSEPHSESRFAAAMKALNRAWVMFYPEQTLAVEPVSDDPDAGFDVFLRDGEPGRLPVDMLSSGQLEIFMFAGALVMEPDPAGIVLIDEPELHLDLQWHRVLLRAISLLKPDSQIIAATHSPEVFDSVRSFERHFLLPADDPRVRPWSQPAIPAEVEA
jgi:energy-coupling factor transporter ATP-binding protein EcfA2